MEFYRESRAQVNTEIEEEQIYEIEHVANVIIRNISENWDVATLRSYFPNDGVEQIKEKDLEKVLKLYSKLGKFREQLLPQSIERITNQDNVFLYTRRIQFEEDKALVRLFLRKSENSYKLIRININAEIFIDQ